MKIKFQIGGIFFIILTLGLLVIGCENDTRTGIVNVKYQLTGTATIAHQISYRDSSREIVNLDNNTLPWEKSISVELDDYHNQNWQFSSRLGVSPMGTPWNGSITAKIFVNGIEVDSQTRDSGSGSMTARYDIEYSSWL